VEQHLLAKHRLAELPGRAWRPQEPLLLRQAPASWPAEMRELLEGRPPLALPEWATALEGKSPAAVAALRGALAVHQLVARSLAPHEEGAGAECAKALKGGAHRAAGAWEPAALLGLPIHRHSSPPGPPPVQHGCMSVAC
jgi:hypothetical protein